MINYGLACVTGMLSVILFSAGSGVTGPSFYAFMFSGTLSMLFFLMFGFATYKQRGHEITSAKYKKVEGWVKKYPELATSIPRDGIISYRLFDLICSEYVETNEKSLIDNYKTELVKFKKASLTPSY